MVADAAAVFFYFCEIGALVPVWFGVVVVRDGIEPWGFAGPGVDDRVRHANDGRRIHTAAEFGEDGAVGTEATADGLAEDRAEVLFVFGVGAMTDSFAGVKIPIFADGVLSRPYEDKRRRGNRLDP